jgi:hypothetical protein
LAVLLLIIILIIFGRDIPPPITVGDVNSIQSDKSVSLTFKITNNSSRRFICYPSSVDVLKENRWQKCFKYNSPGGGPTLGAHEVTSMTLPVTNLPIDSPLRVRLLVSREMREQPQSLSGAKCDYGLGARFRCSLPSTKIFMLFLPPPQF